MGRKIQNEAKFSVEKATAGEELLGEFICVTTADEATVVMMMFLEMARTCLAGLQVVPCCIKSLTIEISKRTSTGTCS